MRISCTAAAVAPGELLMCLKHRARLLVHRHPAREVLTPEGKSRVRPWRPRPAWLPVLVAIGIWPRITSSAAPAACDVHRDAPRLVARHQVRCRLTAGLKSFGLTPRARADGCPAAAHGKSVLHETREDEQMPRSPTAIDQHVGARMRAARLEAGKSQTEVAEPSRTLIFSDRQRLRDTGLPCWLS